MDFKFRSFLESKGYVGSDMYKTFRKQLGTTKKIWMGMPIMLIPNTKIGGLKIDTPTVFYVKDYDDRTVNMVRMYTPYLDDGDEIDMGRSDEPSEIVIDIKDFWKLQELPLRMMKPGMGGPPGGGLI